MHFKPLKKTDVIRRSGSRAFAAQGHLSRHEMTWWALLLWLKLRGSWWPFKLSSMRSWLVDPFWNNIYDLNFICETEKLQSATAFSFYSASNLTFIPERLSTRIYFSPCYPSCQSRCFYLCVFFSFSNGRYLILEWSSLFGAGVSDRTEWGGGGEGEGRLNPRRPAPDSGHKPVRVYISPPWVPENWRD